jgi:hypothetical protein
VGESKNGTMNRLKQKISKYTCLYLWLESKASKWILFRHLFSQMVLNHILLPAPIVEFYYGILNEIG